MKKRLLCLGLVAAVFQLVGTGCGHPIARFRANHPCFSCAPHPLLHPIQTRRAVLGDPIGPVGGPVVVGPVGPVVPPCHGCAGGAPGVPVSYSGGITEGVPFSTTGYPPIVISSQGAPSIGSPMPLAPGGPSGTQLPHPMPLNKNP
ncbi:MAG TPA: hypothetical protein VGE74_30545 [Gemmata sp.]